MNEIKVLPERELGAETPGLAALLASGRAPERACSWEEIEPEHRLPEGRLGDVVLCHMRDVLWLPRRGLIVTSDGTVPAAPAAEVSDLPAAMAEAEQLRQNAPMVERASIWLPGGGRRNYGHFLIDGLSGLGFAEAAGITGQYPALSPVLTDWQRGLLDAFDLSSAERREPALRIGEAVFATTMDHYLQRADGLLRALAQRVQPSRPEAPGTDVLYLSRRGMSGRILLDEAALESALAAQGAQVLRPERMSVAEQIAAMQSARLVIGASGAALANTVFLPPGARLIELRPQSVREYWVPLLARAMQVTLTRIDGSGPLPPEALPLAARLRQMPRRLAGRYHMAWRLPDAGTALLFAELAR